MDGSSYEFVQALLNTGLEEQNALRNFFEIPQGISFKDTAREVELAALPLDDYRLTVMVDYNSPVLGSQHASITDISQFTGRNCALPYFLLPA
jgi:UDP-3-O-[3-hydroxymyristoyl] N-acetylglucosamine deacetylase/3-hydroxyacyl-[acyl-carrier-protein] dehydratase